uniref:NAD(+) synthase (glutamine-hydrolyzing) n=1 Tax=Pseudo-nitzschia australis TaxID=44445 RepID=A0A7S4AGJ1_9STRA
MAFGDDTEHKSPRIGTSLLTVATCTLNQWALDFDGNLERVVESCNQAKAAGAKYRLGPELEICGYGCEDHFLEADTIDHSWQSLIQLLTQTDTTVGMICDFGMPLLGNDGCRYNCRIICFNRKILWVRPKTYLADDGNYRESRYFAAYQEDAAGTSTSTTALQQTCAMFHLPVWVRDELRANGIPAHPVAVPMGGSASFLRTDDGVAIGCETCEELWVPDPSHVELALKGVEIIGNGSGSHHELRKLDKRLELMVAATARCGGIYLYANQRGCDGGRVYYDGGATIVCNGRVLARSPQFCLRDVVVVTATVDLQEVRSFRAGRPSVAAQIQHQKQQQRHGGSCGGVVEVPNCRVLNCNSILNTKTTKPIKQLTSSMPEEECCLGPACWLWDYLRRSGASGYLLPLSGGADSSAVATIVMAMCHLVYDEAKASTNTSANPNSSSNDQVLRDLRRICGKENDKVWKPSSPQEIASHVLHTVFMGTVNSSQNTTNRAKRLGKAIGSYHLTVPIDLMVDAVTKVFCLATGQTPQFLVMGGTMAEDLALQNIQARLRMVTAYLFAQLLPWTRKLAGDTVGKGFLLVLGSANVDEGLRGYMTKYDCSSADLNPIGAISKGDLKRMLLWASKAYGSRSGPVLEEIAGAPPTAELRPNIAAIAAAASDNNDEKAKDNVAAKKANDEDAEHSQLDEEEMGMTYDELGWFGRLRKLGRCGPVSMYRKLVFEWTTMESSSSTTSSRSINSTSSTSSSLTPREVATKVKRFFFYYSINRHKMCTLTPSYHAEGYSPDDNRFDLRPFLYNYKWPRQFHTIDKLVEEYEGQQEVRLLENKFLSR